MYASSQARCPLLFPPPHPPQDLQVHYEGKKEILKALGTSDFQEAKRRVHLLTVEYDLEFEQLNAAAQCLTTDITPLAGTTNYAPAPQNLPLSLADVTSEIQAMAETGLEMFRVSGVLQDRTGLALKIEQLPPRGTLEVWTNAVLLRLRQARQSMEGMADDERELLMGRLRSDLDWHERVLSGELRRLFEGEEMRSFAAQPELAHCYWLPLIGLYTGARVNEVCQLNPQIHIRKEEGIWFFERTEKSAGDMPDAGEQDHRDPCVKRDVKRPASAGFFMCVILFVTFTKQNAPVARPGHFFCISTSACSQCGRFRFTSRTRCCCTSFAVKIIGRHCCWLKASVWSL